jgi:hypothetical protein
MRKGVISAVLLVALAALAACGSSLGKTRTYEFGDLFTIEYPEAWHVYDEIEQRIVLFSPEEGDLSDETPRPAFVILLGATDVVGVSEESTQEFVQGMEVNKVGEIESIKVGGKPAFRQSFEGGEGEAITALQGWVLQAGESPPITILAVAPTGDWKEFEDSSEAMLSTFEFK